MDNNNAVGAMRNLYTAFDRAMAEHQQTHLRSMEALETQTQEKTKQIEQLLAELKDTRDELTMERKRSDSFQASLKEHRAENHRMIELLNSAYKQITDAKVAHQAIESAMKHLAEEFNGSDTHIYLVRQRMLMDSTQTASKLTGTVLALKSTKQMFEKTLIPVHQMPMEIPVTDVKAYTPSHHHQLCFYEAIMFETEPVKFIIARGGATPDIHPTEVFMLCLVMWDEMQVWSGRKPHCNVIFPQYNALASEEFVLYACPVQVEYTLKVPPLNPNQSVHMFHPCSPAEQSFFTHPPESVLDLNDSAPSSRGAPITPLQSTHVMTTRLQAAKTRVADQ